jgi:hypothetical protein
MKKELAFQGELQVLEIYLYFVLHFHRIAAIFNQSCDLCPAKLVIQ